MKFPPSAQDFLRLDRMHNERTLEAEWLATTSRSYKIDLKDYVLNMSSNRIPRGVVYHIKNGMSVDGSCNDKVRSRQKYLNQKE